LSTCIALIEVIIMGLSKELLTEEKVRNLKPIVEQILSRKYGKEIKFLNLTIGDITIQCNEKPVKEIS